MLSISSKTPSSQRSLGLRQYYEPKKARDLKPKTIIIMVAKNCSLNYLFSYVLLTVYLGIIFVNNQLDPQFLFMYVYFYSLHVSGSHVPIIRRINFINTSGIYRLRWSRGSVLAFGTQVRGFKPD